MRRDLVVFVLFIALALITMGLRLVGIHLEAVTAVCVFGAGIVACAFLMGTAAELAQLEVSENLALIVVALLAVLPEYAIDVYLVYQAGDDPHYTPLAMANMTGANRLLIGLGWPVIAYLWWLRSRQREVALGPTHRGAVFYLAVATLYSFAIPLKGTLSMFDSVVFALIFIAYLRYARAQPHEEVELIGPAEVIGRLTRGPRRAATIAVFVVAGGGILASSEPFAEGLIACGRASGIDEYHLIQWLAPLASESPEFLVAALLVWKRNPNGGFGTLLSSKLNQWTLLVGALPLAFALSQHLHGHPITPMPIDARQFGEILLTAAQGFLGVCVLLNRRFSLMEATWLLALFVLQLGVSMAIEARAGDDLARLLAIEKNSFSAAYILIGIGYLIAYRRHLRDTVRSALLLPTASG